jgi:hypothetical protein
MSTLGVAPSKITAALRKHVWDSMLDGEMNDRYYRYRASTYAGREKGLKIFLALTSSGTVAGWTLWSTPPYTLIWKMLSGVSAALAISLPFLDYTGQVERASTLRKGWWELRAKYEQLWAEIQSDFTGSIDERLKPLKQKETELVEIEAKYFKRDEPLVKKCQQEVIRAKGLREI